MNIEEQNTHRNVPLSAVTIIGDVLIFIVLYCTACKFNGYIQEESLRQSAVVVAATYLLCVIYGGVILYKRNVKNFQIVALVLKNLIGFIVASTVILNVGHFYILPTKLSIALIAAQLVLASLYRLLIRFFINTYRINDKHKHHAVLVGSKDNIRALYEEITGVSYFGYAVDGYFDYEPNKDFSESCKYLGTPADVIPYLKTHNNIHELFCCLPSRYEKDIVPIIHYCVNNLVNFNSVPNVSNYLHQRMYLNKFGSVPYLSLYRNPLEKVENRMVKRLFDIVFSSLFLCTLFPFIFIIVSIITKMTMPGPVFFRQKRNGINGKEFYCIKFRSMRVNDAADSLQATKDDPRKTKWGNIMRKMSIDELPQFINVLKGDMSVVGPRPHMLKHTEEYSKLIDKYMIRHFVKPGITGWSQVTGFRGETKELAQMEGRIKGDIWYIEHWSFWLDLYIIYKTVANAIKGDDEAY